VKGEGCSTENSNSNYKENFNLAHSKQSKVRAIVTSMAKTTLSSNDASEKKCQKVQFVGVSSFLRNLKHLAFKVHAIGLYITGT